MPSITAHELDKNPQGICCAECGKELALGQTYHEVRNEDKPTAEHGEESIEVFVIWCEGCAVPVGDPS